MVFYIILKCENVIEIVLEVRCNDKVFKLVKIYWFVIVYNERLLYIWIRYIKNVWFLYVKVCIVLYEWL